MSGAAKALILTDGLLDPSRFRALGVRVCPLVPIANRPLLLHVLDGLRAAGVREAAVVGEDAGGIAVRYVDHADARALDAPAIVVQPADAVLRAPLETALADVAGGRL